MAKTNMPPRGLSSRLTKAVAKARAHAPALEGTVFLTAPSLTTMGRDPDSGVFKAKTEAGVVFRPRLSAGQAVTPAKTKTKKRIIKTSTSSDALRRHVAQAVVGVDLQTPRGLIQIKDRDPVAAHNLSRIVERSPSVSLATRPSDGLGAFLIHDAADLGRAIRLMRDQRDMTQADLADAAGVGRRFISDLEAGKPTAELGKALAVARILGLSLTAATA